MNPDIRITDAAGRSWTFPDPPRRVVSLVPSLTHTLAGMGHAGALVGRTRYCDRPAGLLAEVPAVGGPKDPDIDRILALQPDLVLMDLEENRQADAERLLAAGLRVLALLPTAAADVVPLLRALADIFRSPAAVRGRIDRLEALLDETRRAADDPLPVFCPVWRRPYMSFNGRTYVSSILETTGFRNVCADRPDRYFKVDPADLALPADGCVLLPTEPFPFSTVPLPEAAAELGVPAERIVLVDGSLLTWYGLKTEEALTSLQLLRRHLAPVTGLVETSSSPQRHQGHKA
jgi:ABC-type Fe3+-hydroxamate transport system substrate-binding protein